MPRLEIDLQEGFQNDTVIIEINGEEIFYRHAIKTNLATSLAAKIPVDKVISPASIEIRVPTRGLSKTIVAELPAYVGVSVVDNKLEYQQSERPFRYM
jgi:hypothetical protein